MIINLVHTSEKLNIKIAQMLLIFQFSIAQKWLRQCKLVWVSEWGTGSRLVQYKFSLVALSLHKVFALIIFCIFSYNINTSMYLFFQWCNIILFLSRCTSGCFSWLYLALRVVALEAENEFWCVFVVTFPYSFLL